MFQKAWLMSKCVYRSPLSCNILELGGDFKNHWASNFYFIVENIGRKIYLSLGVSSSPKCSLSVEDRLAFSSWFGIIWYHLNWISGPVGLRLVTGMERKQLGRGKKCSRKEMSSHQPSSESTVIAFIFNSGYKCTCRGKSSPVQFDKLWD